ncbi:hypothetical protein ElyMa_003202800 [Elysia marginata]|uniref:Uncharacterized protein n=1 Tax=Elysia marginata TaxID=1093978 RepID=A0AAV4J4V8_9GAST|nr:hypothetical protein ElyMa_003202800 [Elysia marginata]
MVRRSKRRFRVAFVRGFDIVKEKIECLVFSICNGHVAKLHVLALLIFWWSPRNPTKRDRLLHHAQQNPTTSAHVATRTKQWTTSYLNVQKGRPGPEGLH